VLDSREYAILAAQAAAEKKATDIIVLDVAELIVITDYFVIATGNNDRQVKVIGDEIEKALREAGMRVVGREGEREGLWLLLDFGDVVAHVFQPAEREFYRLEKLWGSAERVALPEGVNAPAATPAEDGGPTE
jgi:ribosome-associated protein